jgi:hypothetical protein
VSRSQTETSARQPEEAGLFARMILGAQQGATTNQAFVMRRESPQYLLVPPNIIFITTDNTVNTYYERLVILGVQTDAGGEAISVRAGQRSLLSSRVDSFSKLPRDWSGEDTIPIDTQTLEIAKRLIEDLPNRWPLPQATPSGEGEVVFTWFKNSNRLEAILQPDRHLIWVTQNNGRYVPGRDIDLSAIASFGDLFEAIALFYK